jgi:hypothetical protein
VSVKDPKQRAEETTKDRQEQHRQTRGQTDRQTDRQTDTHTHTHTRPPVLPERVLELADAAAIIPELVVVLGHAKDPEHSPRRWRERVLAREAPSRNPASPPRFLGLGGRFYLHIKQGVPEITQRKI